MCKAADRTVMDGLAGLKSRDCVRAQLRVKPDHVSLLSRVVRGFNAKDVVVGRLYERLGKEHAMA
jgi:hypothetical protein